MDFNKSQLLFVIDFLVREVTFSVLVAGFQTWKKLGRSVRKGERGIYVLAPMVQKRSLLN
jgi:hypothetical protein